MLPYYITSLDVDNKIYNFTCFYDKYNKIQIYSPYNTHLHNIKINYKIFNTTFQVQIRVLLINLINYPNKFNIVWNKICNIFDEYNKLYASNNNIKVNSSQKNDILNNIKNL